MKERYWQSDLAKECIPDTGKIDQGILQKTRKCGDFLIDTVQVLTPEAAQSIGKPIGNYLTIECGRADHLCDEDRETLARLLSGELRGFAERVCRRSVDSSFSVFLVGLGNASLTADAIGPFTLRRLNATAHLKEHDPMLFSDLECCSVSMLAPGVLGQSGMEAGEIIRAVVRECKPDLIVAIDALAARDLERLASTVQLSDSGIIPGSGIGNHRSGLTKETIGVPVLALGVPTVVSTSTLVWHTLAKAGAGEPDERMRSLLQSGGDFFVSLKECDTVTEQISIIFSRAISLAFLGRLAE
ncbi:MAG: GPR endopeptidase [Ruminococcaceae bacterium]|nr:GPR endopeptidase [Oscillospiraceae bacterium]